MRLTEERKGKGRIKKMGQCRRSTREEKEAQRKAEGRRRGKETAERGRAEEVEDGSGRRSGLKRRPRKDPGGGGARGKEEQRKAEERGGEETAERGRGKEAEGGSGEWSGRGRSPGRIPEGEEARGGKAHDRERKSQDRRSSGWG